MGLASMIRDKGLVAPVRIGQYHYAACDRQRAEEFIAERGFDPAEWDLRPCPSCVVCGEVGYAETDRCWTHRAHTPCSIEGCTKGRKFANGVFPAGGWVCGIHWRQVCPPRSPLRRTYLRFFRIARKLGVEKGRWPVDLERRYWRFFSGMIARHQRRIEGFVHEAEINKLFGWD
jgi:hypothetical protein